MLILPRILSRCLILQLAALIFWAQFPFPHARASESSSENPPPSVAAIVPKNTAIPQGTPYGANLFTGAFASEKGSAVNADYVVQPGDKISVATWGAGDADKAVDVVVDAQGMIFLPTVGPVKVGGVLQSQLNDTVSTAVGKYYQSGVQVYTSLHGAQSVAVFVSGGVLKPGRYQGDPTDTLLHYLDRAHGIDPNRGSYRQVDIMRSGTKLATVDLYDFLMKGAIPALQLKDNDVIFVHGLAHTAQVEGAVQNPYRFEFSGDSLEGKDLLAMARPHPSTTHAVITGMREGSIVSSYIPLSDLASTLVHQGDRVEFKIGTIASTMSITITGEHLGPQVVVAGTNATLKQVLRHVKIDSTLANYQAIYLRRKSVAERQKQALHESLRRLEESVLATRPQSATDAQMRTQEAALVQMFVDRVKQVEPEGRVVVAEGGTLRDITLEDGDEIIIPRITNLVMVNGEVAMPKAVVYQEGEPADYYISRAGGYSERADEGHLILARANGETIANASDIRPGDEIIVMPEVSFSELEVTKDVVDILYKVAISVAVPLQL